ncbi:unnamed protein product [Orchesella dallaii]|uniref:E3 ubiquitin-protein ligase n=1 Tax=Orchesella dallaii TaxID=48710 RepID=A0ABP1QF67_9HEXA
MADLPPTPRDDAPIGDKEDSEETSTDAGAAGNSQDSSGGLECPICLQPCMHPVELPCHHVFCYLCIKGVAIQGPNSRCAICRAQIPYSVLTNPHLKDVSQLTKEPKVANGYQWYYESRGGGWWQYDERTMQELEKAYSSKLLTCQLLLAGHIYVVDFTQMIQYRSNNRNVSRRIKRGINCEKRGVAGIRIAGNNSGDGSNGGTNNGSPPPPPSSGTSGRRRRGNTSAPANAQTTHAPGNLQASGVSSRSPVLPNPNGGNPSGSSSRENDGLASDSDDESVDEDEDYDSDYSEDVDADDDMELGEEEEALIGDDSEDTEDDDEYDTRDGARAPTRRSDRSNSSNNQTPPPPSGAGPANGSSSRTYSPNSNGRGSRGAKSGRNSGGGRANNGSSGTTSRTAPMDHFATAPSSYPILR